MDGSTIRDFFKQEVQSMLDLYKSFEILIPAPQGCGSEHKGEDGRFVENLIRSFLEKHLPKELEVLTGFIVRPAVKTDKNNRGRESNQDMHSTQLDIIVYDNANYPVYLRSNDTVIVPPEGVISIISVKKTLNDADVKNELGALLRASKLCRSKELRAPFLALVSMSSKINKSKKDTHSWIFKQMEEVYQEKDDITFDDLIGYIGAFKQWGIFKARPNKSEPCKGKYVLFQHKKGEEHLGLQFLMTGILSVYYDNTRNTLTRPGFTSFQSGRKPDKTLGKIEVGTPSNV